MSNPNSYRQPFDLPCKDCGEAKRRLRVVHTQSGPALKFGMRAPLYCRGCAPARLKSANDRFDAKIAANRRTA